ncbi:hypothetical protein GCM10027570_38870 [Streptomonospora sediminis]
MTIVIITLVSLSIAMFPAQPTAATAATLGLQLVHSLPQTKRFRGWWTLAAQAALFPWSEPKGFLGAAVLLVVPGRARWPVLGAVVVWAGLLADGGFTAGLIAAANALFMGLVIFGLTRLSDLRSELHASRRELAAQAVAEERHRISRDLDTVLGSALSVIIGLAGKRRSAEILELARDAAAQVRRAPETRPNPVAQADMTPRLAVPVVASGMAAYLSSGLLSAVSDPGMLTVTGFAIVLAVVGLQVYHLLTQRHGARPYPWDLVWTLPLQTALALVPLIYAELEVVNSLVSLAAASALIAVPRRRAAWALFAGIVLTELLVLTAVKTAPFIDIVMASVATVAVAMIFYGLALLTRLVTQVHESRQAIAAIAVANERRRITADIHDLLGYGLSAITVKAELAARDPRGADAEFCDIARMARGTLADLRTIPYDDHPEISLHAEGASAREILTAAGIDVRLDIDTGLLTDEADALLATVLREAATNILRHSRAGSAAIEAAATGTHLRLRVANDGAAGNSSADTADIAGADDSTPAPRRGGNGLVNLAERVAAAGGELTAGPTGGGYELVATYPLPRGARPGGPAAAPARA